MIRKAEQGLSRFRGLNKISSMSLKSSFSLFLFALLITNLFLPTSSAPVVDPNAPIGFQPSILNPVTNGYVINIVNPDSNGLSHNKYSEFNAASNESIVFNNSTNPGISALVGSILANPNLTSGSASTILNEVTGFNKSILNGSFEIFGVKANLIFANPNGISLNGASFINTGTLNFIAGIPNLSNNVLSYDPKENIDIGINGLNAANTDGLGFFAQQIINNGNITGPNAKAPVNLQMVDYHSIDSNVAPGRIFVPIDSKGNVYGTKMDDLKMNIHNADQWEIADGKIQMKAGNIQNTGNIISNNNLILESNQFQNTGNINNTSAGDTVITARTASSGNGITNTGTVNSIGNLSIIADSVLNNGNLKSNADINILATDENSIVRSKGDQRLSQGGSGNETINYGIWNTNASATPLIGANIEAGNNINLYSINSNIRNSNSDIFAGSAAPSTGGNLTITAKNLVNERTGFYTLQFPEYKQGAEYFYNPETGLEEIKNHFYLNKVDKAGTGREAYLGAFNNVDISTTGDILNKGSLLESGNNLNVSGNNFTNEQIVLQTEQRDRWRRGGLRPKWREVYRYASKGKVNSGVFASGDANFNLTGNFTNTGRVDVDQNLNISATNITNGITDPNTKTPVLILPEKIISSLSGYPADSLNTAQTIELARDLRSLLFNTLGKGFIGPDWKSEDDVLAELRANAESAKLKDTSLKWGEALTDEQIAKLTKPILWYENGQYVVYFPKDWRNDYENNIAENDAVGLMIANNIDLKANTKIVDRDFQVIDDKATGAARTRRRNELTPPNPLVRGSLNTKYIEDEVNKIVVYKTETRKVNTGGTVHNTGSIVAARKDPETSSGEDLGGNLEIEADKIIYERRTANAVEYVKTYSGGLFGGSQMTRVEYQQLQSGGNMVGSNITLLGNTHTPADKKIVGDTEVRNKGGKIIAIPNGIDSETSSGGNIYIDADNVINEVAEGEWVVSWDPDNLGKFLGIKNYDLASVYEPGVISGNNITIVGDTFRNIGSDVLGENSVLIAQIV